VPAGDERVQLRREVRAGGEVRQLDGRVRVIRRRVREPQHVALPAVDLLEAAAAKPLEIVVARGDADLRHRRRSTG
jgi:hypothetical protein